MDLGPGLVGNVLNGQHLRPHVDPAHVRPAVEAYVQQHYGKLSPDEIKLLVQKIIEVGGPLLDFILAHWPKPALTP